MLPLDGYLGKTIVEILPPEEDPDQVLGFPTSPQKIPGRLLHNGKGTGTTGYGPRIHNTI